MAIAGSSQQRSAEAIEARSGAKIGHEKIRSIVKELASDMEEHRQDCQLEQLQSWIDEARIEGEGEMLASLVETVSSITAPRPLKKEEG